MSRTAWYIIGMAVLALLLVPTLVARWRAVRRAVGAFAVFWVSASLWGTGLYLLGALPLASGAAALAIQILPPLAVMLAWLAFDLRARKR